MLGAYKVGVAAAAGLTAAFALQGQLGDYSKFVDVTTNLLAGVAVYLAAKAMLKYGKGVHTQSGRIWPAFMIGLSLWFLGEVTYSVYYEFLNVAVPYPSIADVFYLGGYIPFFVGLFLYVRYFSSAITKRVVALVAIGVIVAGALVVIFLIDPVLTETADLLTRFLDFAYPISDLILFSLALMGLSVFAGGSIGRSWVFLNLAIILNVVADMMYSYLTALELYVTGSFPDLLYMFGYISFALAFYLHRREL